MKKTSVILALAVAGTAFADPFEKAEVTRTVNKVSILQNQKAPKPAEVGSIITPQTAVQTGADSRAELQFPDKTITRLGSNALFRFNSGGRDMTLDGGTLLFSCPKNEGGGQVQAGAVTAAVTGTDFIISYIVGGEVRVVVLEGKVWVFLTKFPAIRRMVKSGELVVIPAGATKIEEVKRVDLKELIKTSRLLESGGFKTLPSDFAIQRAANGQGGGFPFFKRPDGTPLAQQAAQQARNSGGPPKPPRPLATPPPKPKPPTPTPPPAPPKPRPTPGPPPGPGP